MTAGNRPIKIAFDAKRLFYNHTGLGNYSRTLVRNLQKYYPDNEYHLFTPAIKENEETDYFINSGKFIIHTPGKTGLLYRTWRMSGDILQLRPDIFHGLSHELPFGLDKNIRTVVTFHDLIYERFPGQFGLWDRFAYKWKYRSAAMRSDKILAISHSTKMDLEKIYHLPPEKIEVVYQSCHEDFQMKENDPSLWPEVIRNLDKYFLYVGSIIERKGLLDCIMAYRELPDQFQRPFVVVGSGKGPYADTVREAIRNWHLEDKFIFLHGISNHDLVHIYDGCSIFLYPSSYEGFGIPVIESLFRHKPVITTTVSSLPEAAGEGGVLLEPHDAEGIRQAVIRFMTDKDYYRTTAQKGKAYVTENFSSEITAHRLMELYLSLIK